MVSKALKIFLGFVAVLLILIGVGYYLLFFSGVTKAQLYVESGEVLVNGVSVQSSNVQTTMKAELLVVELDEGDVIETGTDGLARVILYDSVVINLEGGTKVSLDDLTRKNPQVSQEGGETWNTFTKLSGVEAYSIKTGETIASVRATAFGIKNNYILGGEGNVSYFAGGEDFLVSEKKVVEFVDGIFVTRDATPEEIAKIKVQMEKAVRDLQRLRVDVLERNPKLVSLIEKQTGLSEDEFGLYMEQIDNGEIDIDELMSQVPVKTDVIERLEGVTRAILKIKAKINSLDG